ncbi:sensor histidine kinase [Cohnella sp.]|uniref:cache domain-containing sensor histidine kinase n=1 Tax=Cohnella sp. TaxID=1883426 RepID=UPI003703B2A9
MSSRNKLILLLVVPGTLFVMIVTQIAKDYALEFLRETQNESLAGMSDQVVHLIGIYNNEITYNMLEMEEIIKQEGGQGDRLYEAMRTVAMIRADFVRGVVYIAESGDITGYPITFWGNFSAKEEALIHEQAERSRGVFEWSNTIRSDIGRSGTFGPTSIVTKTVFDTGGKQIGYLAFLVDLSAFLERSAAFAGAYETQTLLYDREDRLIDFMGAINVTTPVLISEEYVQTLSSALSYFRREGIYHSVGTMEANLGWKIVVVGDVEKLESRFEPLSQIAWAIVLFGVLGFLCIYVAVSWWFTRPVMLLTKGIRKVAKGDLDSKLHIRQQDEFGELGVQFNRMTATIKALIVDLQATEEAKRKSEMQTLLSQINPHFLYNTLNTIDMMVDFSPKRELHEMINVLCRLLKYSLDSRSEERTLEDELQYTKNYLYIQSVRYDNRFEIAVSLVSERLGAVKVLKLILQPIVENALFHGLHPLEGRQGRLDIEVEERNGDLTLIVRDNGVGMSWDRLSALRSALSGMEAEDGIGIGVLNVHRRIRLYYGAEYGLAVDSAIDEGTTITVKLPLENQTLAANKERLKR